MSEADKTIRLSKVKGELNVSLDRIFEFLDEKGFKIDRNPNQKISEDMYRALLKEFAQDREEKEESKLVGLTTKTKKESIILNEDATKIDRRKDRDQDEILIKDMNNPSNKSMPVEKEKKKEKKVEEVIRAAPEKTVGVKVVSKIDLEPEKTKAKKKKAEEEKESAAEKKKTKKKVEEEVKEVIPETPVVEVPETPVPPPPVEEELFRRSVEKLEGPKIMGKIELPVKEERKKPVASSSAQFEADKKKKRKRIRKEGGPVTHTEGTGQAGRGAPQRGGGKGRPATREPKAELTEEEVQKQIKETLARLSGAGKSKASKYRRDKRDQVSQRMEQEAAEIEAQKGVLKVTEFVTANQLASMMNVPVTQIISTCMSIGLFVSINQRLDAETISLLAQEFGYKVEFVSVEVQEAIKEEEDKPEELLDRPPIVTVMGHVDHGKTSLLDYIRKSNVIAGEAGGITQHIGAYSVQLENGKHITFLDTPGHEAFTAMRARGAQVTDVAIIVVAADDSVMPQTTEAINHAQAAGVPIVFAINKIDKPGANPDKIREALAQMNILVEEWGGKYQCQEISAKKGQNIDVLLEKVLLEADMLQLKANPEKRATGVIIESTLDKGRGYTATVLVENGTMHVGDVVLAGCYSGRVKAMHNERGQDVEAAGPATPVQILGLSGAPQAGDQFNIMADEREARDIATRRLQLQREQQIRTTKHITLDEIGRRLAIGDFQELNVIIKGDVDGSIEALADSLLKLSTEKIQIRIVHKGVGAISESDVLLASASNAIIVGFQVRPSVSARKLAETEQIDIRLYSIIYKAIEEIKAAMEGMLAPEFVEKITGNIEVREVFKISKVGTVAGCYVLDGKVNRQTKVRIIRNGIVLHDGTLGSLKRFKDDVKEVTSGYECGLNIDKFDNIEVGDIIEGYEMVEVKGKL
ncbi:MAG TPA: translation initiation factor IF-2 [Bacteroidia bacterium]|jgi:translation initiation factor IF-2|nr:translation initiation factor IF-2 [Bacteroidia bacterium]